MIITTSYGEVLQRSVESAQYTSEQFQRLLSAHGIICSMSRSGNCWDTISAVSARMTSKPEAVNQHEGGTGPPLHDVQAGS